MDILILIDRSAERLTVTPAAYHASIPPGLSGRVVGPGDEYGGRTYREWLELLGSTVEMPQAAAAMPIAGVIEDWRPELEIDDRPIPGQVCGYHDGERIVGCSRSELMARCAAHPGTLRVWTPETQGLVPPETLPFLVDAHRARVAARARRATLIALAGTALALSAYALFFPAWVWSSTLVLVPAFGALAAVQYGATWRRAPRIGPAAFAAGRERERHGAWLNSRPRPYTLTIAGCLVAVAFVQLVAGGEAIPAAGLVKPAVRDGEVWRMLTGPMLHVNLTHIWFNVAALLAVGPLVEVHGRRAHLPIVFLAAAVCGSLLSVAWTDVTSVGASGGIMGLIGYVLVLARRRPSELPHGMTARVMIAIGFTAVIGVVGYRFIDNGAHLGGMLAGVVLGRRLIPAGGEAPPLRPDSHFAAVALAAVVLVAVGTAARLIGALLGGAAGAV